MSQPEGLGETARARWSVLHYINVGGGIGVGTAEGCLVLKVHVVDGINSSVAILTTVLVRGNHW